uniref:EB domain-containing protein n=1 Tax=Macrostomum lignano TaxID=282301 RepID=A0A1I8J358_9PLAT
CCPGGGYQSVPNGSVCCRDAEFPDAFNVGLGNACCGGLPYYNETDGDQVCCGGHLHSSLNQQCCGGQMVPNDLVCCGDSIAYQPQSNMSCCGDQYVLLAGSDSETVCCQEGSEAQLYTLSRDNFDGESTWSCCGLQLVKGAESSNGCCAGRKFNSSLEVCASSD